MGGILRLGLFLFLLGGAVPAVAGYEEAARSYASGDHAAAFRDLGPLAEAGEARAQSLLGLMYARGHGTPPDFAKAFELFGKAASQGDAVGAYGMGVSYLNGDGVPKDKGEAARWLRMAAEKGHPRASYLFGLMLVRGDGVTESFAEGMEFMQAARRLGDPQASDELRGLLDAAGKGWGVSFEGGFGDSMETAVAIRGVKNSLDGVRAEHRFLALLHPGWRKERQALLNRDGKVYDGVKIGDGKGRSRDLYFEITPWFGRLD